MFYFRSSYVDFRRRVLSEMEHGQTTALGEVINSTKCVNTGARSYRSCCRQYFLMKQQIMH